MATTKAIVAWPVYLREGDLSHKLHQQCHGIVTDDHARCSLGHGIFLSRGAHDLKASFGALPEGVYGPGDLPEGYELLVDCVTDEDRQLVEAVRLEGYNAKAMDFADHG